MKAFDRTKFHIFLLIAFWIVVLLLAAKAQAATGCFPSHKAKLPLVIGKIKEITLAEIELTKKEIKLEAICGCDDFVIAGGYNADTDL